MKKNIFFYFFLLLISFTPDFYGQTESIATTEAVNDSLKEINNTLQEKLVEAVKNEDRALILQILNDPQAKKIDNYYLTKALELAAEKNLIEIAKILTNFGANIKDPRSNCLPLVAGKGYFEMVELLLSVQGADSFNYGGSLLPYTDQFDLNYKRDLALIEATRNGHLNIVQLLINSGANLEVQDFYGEKPLTIAIKKQQIKIVQTLIKAKANVNAPDGNGFNPLSIAIQLRNPDLIAALLAAPKINVSHVIRDIEDRYEKHCKGQIPAWYRENKKYAAELKIDEQIFALFAPFMKKKK